LQSNASFQGMPIHSLYFWLTFDVSNSAQLLLSSDTAGATNNSRLLQPITSFCCYQFSFNNNNNIQIYLFIYYKNT